jgi:hypothetical protein
MSIPQCHSQTHKVVQREIVQKVWKNNVKKNLLK